MEQAGRRRVSKIVFGYPLRRDLTIKPINKNNFYNNYLMVRAQRRIPPKILMARWSLACSFN
jgi:hypothetical protein